MVLREHCSTKQARGQSECLCKNKRINFSCTMHTAYCTQETINSPTHWYTSPSLTRGGTFLHIAAGLLRQSAMAGEYSGCSGGWWPRTGNALCEKGKKLVPFAGWCQGLASTAFASAAAAMELVLGKMDDEGSAWMSGGVGREGKGFTFSKPGSWLITPCWMARISLDGCSLSGSAALPSTGGVGG